MAFFVANQLTNLPKDDKNFNESVMCNVEV